MDRFEEQYKEELHKQEIHANHCTMKGFCGYWRVLPLCGF